MPSGFGLVLRPVTVADAESILELRRHPQLGAFLGNTDSDVGAQRAWIEAQQARPGDHYFAITRQGDGAFLGTISAYQVDRAADECEWGRWVLQPGSPAALGSVVLLLDFIVGELGLSRFYCRTMAANHPVVSFHDSLGVPRSDRVFPPGAGVHPDTAFVVHSADAEQWRRLRERAARLAAAAARFL